MNDSDLEKYCNVSIEEVAADAKLIHPSSVVTAPWVRWKCQFGCVMHGKGYCCPPNSPTPEQTREMLDCYHRGILYHVEMSKKEGRSRLKFSSKFYEILKDLEGELFKDGYYKAFVFVAGHCYVCKECAKLQGEPCNFGDRARPSMEASGIDVYQTARNSGFFIQPLREKSETWNFFCLMMVD